MTAKCFNLMVCNVNEVTLKVYDKGIPILWNNNGLCGIIPVPFLENLFANGGPPKKVYWHETIRTPPHIAKLFLGEDENEQCTYRTKGTT